MLIIGTGEQSFEYAKVLSHLKIDFKVIGNAEKSCMLFYQRCEQELGVRPIVRPGKIENNQTPIDEMAIVSVPIAELFDTTKRLIVRGVKEILVEKPVTLYMIQLRALDHLSLKYKNRVYVAHNRRFFQTVQKAKEIIKAEGLKELFFCFGEDMNAVQQIEKHPQIIKDRWAWCNSTHCIDTAFFISGGIPGYIESTSRCSNKFTGKGEAACGGGIKYHTDWNKNKRWSIDFCTNLNKFYYLSPFEKLKFERDDLEDCEKEYWEVVSEVDESTGLKPGMLEMVQSFLSDKKDLPLIEEYVTFMNIVQSIGGLTE